MSANVATPAAPGPRLPGGVAEGNYQRILRDPKFQELAGSRRSFGWTLTVLMLIIYYGFILVVAFDKPLLAQKLGDSTTTVGIVVGLGVIVAAFILTAIYVARANGRYDELTRELKQEFGR